MFFKSLDKSGVILKVLLVDADKTSQLILTAMIKRFGYDVSVAVDCQQALDILQQYPVCLVLIAANNHDVSSLQICSQLKNHNNSFSLYIILLSADHSVEYMIKALENGVHDVLPISPVPVQLKCRMGVGERALMAKEELIIARDEAETSNQSKSAFLANMSHELRTPLNAIIGYSEILLEEVIDDGHDDYIPIVSPITNAGHNLLKIIDSILDIAHVESGKLEAVIQNIDVDELVQEVVDEIIPIISKNKNNLKINISEEVGVIRQDSEKLSKMLENLLDNAAKYTDSADIVLTVESKMEEGSRYITFKVQDTGIGIEADKIEIIFEPFMQADNSYTRNYDGAGLGLSLVKKYVDLMKGVINVKSEVGVGSSFSICVPVFD